LIATASLMTPWGAADKVGTLAISNSASGDTTLISGTSGSFIVVLGMVLVAAGTVVVTFKDSTPATISGPFTMGTSTGNVGDCSVNGLHFACGAGKDLVMNLGSAVNVGGHLVYALVKGGQ